MVVRRIVYRLLFPMAFLLPVWLLIGRGIVFAESGWTFAGFLILSPVLFVVLCLIGALVAWRPGVRQQRAASRWDAVVLIALWLVLTLAGFVLHSAVATLAMLLVLAAFWFTVWELVTEGRRRARAMMDDVNATLGGARASVPPQPQHPSPVDIGEVIAVTSRDVTDEPHP